MAAHVVTEFLHGNPYATRVGMQVEQATDPTLQGENWALNMAICDLVNGSEEGPRDAIRAIRKRLKDHMGKNNQIVMNTLTILETCVKNCDHRLHQLVAQKEFVQELVKLIGPKYDPPQEVQEKVLSLIQCWADAFRNQPDLKGVCDTYDELKLKGVEFPMTDIDAMAPIFTPRRSVFQQQPPPSSHHASTAASPKRPQQQRSSPGHLAATRSPGGTTSARTHQLSPEQLAKLRSELDIVAGNLRILQEMLSELHPGQEDADDFQLMQDLYNTLRQMQTRLLELLDSVGNEEVTSELLVTNDELNNMFTRYNRYMANRNQQQNTHQSSTTHPPSQTKRYPERPQASAAGAAGAGASDTSPPLIDFGSGQEEDVGADLSQQLAALKVNGGGVSSLPQTTAATASSNFDMFEQTRSSSLEQSRQSGSTYYDNSAGLDQTTMSLGSIAQQRSQLYGGNTSKQSSDPAGQQSATAVMKESDYNEMEEWLQQQDGLEQGGEQQQQRSDANKQQQRKNEDRLFSL